MLQPPKLSFHMGVDREQSRKCGFSTGYPYPASTAAGGKGVERRTRVHEYKFNICIMISPHVCHFCVIRACSDTTGSGLLNDGELISCVTTGCSIDSVRYATQKKTLKF